jgi:hypothetical protein
MLVHSPSSRSAVTSHSSSWQYGTWRCHAKWWSFGAASQTLCEELPSVISQLHLPQLRSAVRMSPPSRESAGVAVIFHVDGVALTSFAGGDGGYFHVLNPYLILCNCVLRKVHGFIGVMHHMHDRNSHKTNFMILCEFLWRQAWQTLLRSSLSWAILRALCPGTCLAFRPFHSASCILSSLIWAFTGHMLLSAIGVLRRLGRWVRRTFGTHTHTHTHTRTRTQVNPFKQAIAHTPFHNSDWMGLTHVAYWKEPILSPKHTRGRLRLQCEGTRVETDFVFRRNGRVYLNRRGRQFSRLLAAEVCASAVVMLDTPCYAVVWRVLATHSIRQFPLHFPSRASPCAITFQLDSTRWIPWPLTLGKLSS